MWRKKLIESSTVASLTWYWRTRNQLWQPKMSLSNLKAWQESASSRQNTCLLARTVLTRQISKAVLRRCKNYAIHVFTDNHMRSGGRPKTLSYFVKCAITSATCTNNRLMRKSERILSYLKVRKLSSRTSWCSKKLKKSRLSNQLCLLSGPKKRIVSSLSASCTLRQGPWSRHVHLDKCSLKKRLCAISRQLIKQQRALI